MTIQRSAELTAAVYDSDGVTVVEVAGELDLYTAETLRETLVALDLDGELDVRMDLTGLELLDSSGIGVVVSVCKRVRASGGRFTATCHAGLVRRAIEVSGLVEYLQVDEAGPLG